MYQKIIAIGRLTRDPETKNFDGGKSVTRFTLAVEDGFGDKKNTTFFNCSAWNKTGQSIQNYMTKGSMMSVEGIMKSNKVEDKIYWELSVNNATFLDSKSNQQGQQNQQQFQQPPQQQYQQQFQQQPGQFQQPGSYQQPSQQFQQPQGNAPSPFGGDGSFPI